VEIEIVSPYLAAGRTACAEPKSDAESQPTDGPLELARRTFIAAILAGHRQAALGVVEEAHRNGSSHVDIYVDVFSESLHAVGALWEQNKISVAQEHMATAITQYVIAMIYPRLVPTLPCRGSMVVTGVAGEQHQIGANLVADAMEENGWAVRFLGTNLPPSTVLSTLEDTSADVLSISTTLIANLPAAAELIKVVRGKLGERAPRIVLGGAAYRVAPHFAQEIGSVEAVPDLRGAIALLCP
jgi:methanogenic corrinoid protein MtbC1